MSTPLSPALRGAWLAVGGGAALLLRGALALSREEDQRRDIAERLVLDKPPRAEEQPLWLHAASVGEVGALAPLARALASRLPGVPLLVTTATPTGRERARRELELPARLAPLDARGPLGRFLERMRPRLHVIIETELWPQRLARLEARGVPAALVSGRLSRRHWSKTRRLAPLYGPALASLGLVSAASEEDEARLVELGARQEALAPRGNLKWDAAPTSPPLDEVAAIAGQFGLGATRRRIVLGSVHPGEAGPLVARLLADGRAQELGVIVAPRHPARFDELAAELAAVGHPPHRLSTGPAPQGAQVVLVDRLGLLAGLYPLAVAALLGGTFAPVGGHSPLEAAAAGCPQVVGPHHDKQEDLVGPLADAGALARVADLDAAAEQIAAWLADEDARRRAGETARGVIDERRGHAERLAELLVERLT